MTTRDRTKWCIIVSSINLIINVVNMHFYPMSYFIIAIGNILVGATLMWLVMGIINDD